MFKNLKNAQKKEKKSKISETIIKTNPKKKVDILVSTKFPENLSLNKSKTQPLAIISPNKKIKETLFNFKELKKKTKNDIIPIDKSIG